MLRILFIAFFALIVLSVLMELLFPKRSAGFKTMVVGLFSLSTVLFLNYLVWDVGQRFNGH